MEKSSFVNKECPFKFSSVLVPVQENNKIIDPHKQVQFGIQNVTCPCRGPVCMAWSTKKEGCALIPDEKI